MSLIQPQTASSVDYYVASQSPQKAMEITQHLRQQGFRVECDLSDGKKALGKQMEQAGKLNAANIVIMGETELAANRVTVKNRASNEQSQVPLDQFLARLPNPVHS